jgi:hypothetical protein
MIERNVKSLRMHVLLGEAPSSGISTEMVIVIDDHHEYIERSVDAVCNKL